MPFQAPGPTALCLGGEPPTTPRAQEKRQESSPSVPAAHLHGSNPGARWEEGGNPGARREEGGCPLGRREEGSNPGERREEGGNPGERWEEGSRQGLGGALPSKEWTETPRWLLAKYDSRPV